MVAEPTFPSSVILSTASTYWPGVPVNSDEKLGSELIAAFEPLSAWTVFWARTLRSEAPKDPG